MSSLTTQSLKTSVKCGECPIRHRAVCSRCEGDELTRLETIKTYRSFAAGDPILWRGDKLTFVASVVSGVATLSKGLEDGRTQMVGLLLPSDFCAALNAARLKRCLSKSRTSPSGWWKSRWMNWTPHANGWYFWAAKRRAKSSPPSLKWSRGAKTWMRQAVTHQRSPCRCCGPKWPITLGLTLETVSRQLSILKKNGVIEFTDKRHFRVLDMAGLHDATGDDADGGILS